MKHRKRVQKKGKKPSSAKKQTGKRITKKKKPSFLKKSRQKPSSAPLTVKQYLALSEGEKELHNLIVQVVTAMRDRHLSPKKAAAQYGLRESEFKKRARSALRKNKKGKFVARPYDKLIRETFVPTSKGLKSIILGDSREASLVGKYWNHVQEYIYTGDASGLRNLPRKTVTDANGKRIRLITNLAEIDRLAAAGVLSFESIYGKVSD